MRRILHILILLCLTFSVSAPATAQPTLSQSIFLPVMARNYTAPTVWDVPGLIAAIEASNANCGVPATIVLAPATYTFTTTADLYVALPRVRCNLTIIGNSATLTRAPNGEDMRFFETWGGSLTLKNLTLRGANRGVIANYYQLTLQDVLITHNVTYYGGMLQNMGTASLERVKFIANNGGAISNGFGNSTLTGSDVQLIGNTGGALYAADGTVSLQNACIAGNSPNTLYGAAETTLTHVVQNDGGGAVNLSSSWWGSASGPGGAGPGAGESISANVAYSPHLSSAPAGCPTDPAVTALVVDAQKTVSFDMGTFLFPNQPITLTASVYGIGAFSPALNWSVIAGSGNFADPAANPAVFTPTGLGPVTLRAAAVSNPDVYVDFRAETAQIELTTFRKWATVLTGGSVPFNAFITINGSYYARGGPLSFQIIQGGGTLTPPADPYTSVFYYNGAQTPGKATVRAAFKANPAVFQDMQVNINASGPHTCPNLPVTSTGYQEFSIGMNPPAGAPVFTKGSINEAGALIGDTQVVTVSAYVKEPAISPISVMTFTFNSDTSVSAPVLGTLISGDGFNGVWTASWVTDAIQCETQGVSFFARNDVQVSIGGLGFR